MNLVTPRAAIAALVLFSGCTPPRPPPPQPEPVDGSVPVQDGGTEKVVQVGTGTDAFMALRDGDPIQIIAGPQGGFHLWTAIRVRAPIEPRQLDVRVRVVLGSADVSSTDYRLNLVANGPYHEWYGMLAMIPDPAAVRGKDVQLGVEVKDSGGRSGSDSRRVIPSGP